MDIHGIRVQSPTFGSGIITEQSEATVTVAFNGIAKKFAYPSAFEKFLTAEDSAVQAGITSEIALEQAREARQLRAKRNRAMLHSEQQKAEARRSAKKK